MPSPRLSRRGFVLGGTAAMGLAGAGLLGGCTSTIADPPPDALDASGAIDGPLWGGNSAPWRLVWPRREKPRALVVGLHGKGGSADSSYALGLADAAIRHGFAFVSVSGGYGYWHRRRDGRDPGRLVLDHVIPVARRQAGLSTRSRLAFVGWSMGGYGSLLLAGQVPEAQLIGVCALSAALWTSPGASAPGAFDDAEDYAAHDVFAPTRLLPKARIALMCGTSDPFIAGNRAYAEGRPATAATLDAGGHDDVYWRTHVEPAMAFLAGA